MRTRSRLPSSPSHADATSRHASTPGTARQKHSLKGLLERLTPRRSGLAWLTPFALLIIVAVGLTMIGWGQYAVSQGQMPFDWPFTARMDTLFVSEFHKKNALAFGVPLYVVGGLIFAVFAPRAALPAFERWAGKISVPRGRILLTAAILIVPATAWAWVNYRLFTKHYDPVYRWVFFLSIAAVLVILCALDWMQGRFTRPRFTRWHLVELAVVASITGTFIGINCRDLSNWRYSAIGDENVFYVTAQRILTGPPLNWFSQRGPYGEHPVLSSVWQALSMRVFGDGLFGWKMASLLAIAFSLPLFYWLLRQLFGASVATFGTLFLGASHYLFAYAHTGYNNIFPILPTVICLALLVAGIRRGSFVLLFASGIFAGMGFYTFYSSRAAIGIAVLVLVAVGWRRLQIASFIKVAAGFVMFALPIFASDKWDVINAMLDQSTRRADYPPLKLILENIPRTLLGFNYNPSEHHYVAGGLMDEVSATLAVAGFFLALTHFRHFGHRTLMIWFLVAATVAGVLSPYGEVSTTRLHYALPPMAAFAGIAVDRLLASLSAVSRRQRLDWFVGATAFAVLAPVVFIMNGQHFFVYSAKHSPTTADTVIIRELSDPRCRQQPLRSVLYHPQPDLILDFDWTFFGMSDEKPLQIRFSDMSRVYNAYPATGGVGCVVLANPFDPETQRVASITAADSRGEQDFRIVTDASGAQNRRVALAPASDDRGSLKADDLKIAWRTNFKNGNGIDRVVQGQEKAFIDTVDSPNLVPTTTSSLTDREPVAVVSDGKTAFAYPLRYLVWHHVVNGTLNGQPIAVTYDPISGAIRVFGRTVDGRTLSFGNSGLFRDGNALLYDRETESWWQQLTGAAIVGEFKGSVLDSVPFAVSSWSEFTRAFPDGQALILSPYLNAPSSGARYGANPYLGYDVPNGKPIFTLTPPDPRLAPMHRVAVVEVGGQRFAVPFPDEGASENRVFTFEIGGQEVVLFFDRLTSSTLDTQWLHDSRSVGTFTAYVASYDGHPRAFTATPEGFIDNKTSTVWSVFGRGLAGGEHGAQLEPVPLVEGFWFAVSAAYPQIEIRP